MAKQSVKKTAEKTATKSAPESQVMQSVSLESSNLKQIYRVSEKTTQEEILRYAEMPGVELEFDVARFQKLEESFVGMLPANAQKQYWLALADFESRRKLANRALYETPTAVDPMSKLLDGPHGMANPLTRDAAEVQKLAPEYYVTWRIEGGQGDLDNALRAGFRVMRRPKDDTEKATKSPLEWSGERWRVRDGTVDPQSGDEIFNVMVYIRQGAWKDNLDAISMISHNAYSTNKKQFFEGVDNISRDMLSSKERIQVSDLDELHVEEHTIVKDGKRVPVDS
jgi:hypothetical protein